MDHAARTFLFTDIVGSTRLWESDPAAMSVSLRIHDELIRAAIASFSGEVFANPGDAFGAVFHRVHAALQAATHIQLQLGAVDWLGGPALEVRIGVHTGQAEVRDNNYFGPTINTCARVCDAGHGGQILLTEAVDVTHLLAVHSCGLHRLKGVAFPLRLLQVGEERFPPLRTLDASTTNLPVAANDLVGRDEELDELASLLETTRLLTLTGPGGVGKTRLSFALADRNLDVFADGVWVAELAAARDLPSVMSTVANCLRVPAAATPERLAAQIRGHDLLLILDNCEHVIDDVAELCHALMASTRRLKVLATSREAIGIDSEQVFRVDPLRSVASATSLFVQRSRQIGGGVGPDDMSLVADICRTLDCIPLAIELAAATARVMGLAELRARLDEHFDVLRSSSRSRGPKRHQTLRAAIDWSYESLDDTQQTFFRRLSVFNGGFPIDGAEAMAAGLKVPAAQLIGDLVDRSLLTIQTRGSRARYLLLETLRQYGLDRLTELGETDAVNEMHIAWCFDFASRLAQTAFGAAEVPCINGLVDESRNLRRAIATLLSTGQGHRAGYLVLTVEDFVYTASVLAELVGPLMSAGVVDDHPERRRLQSIELIRRATSDGTQGRAELAADLAAELQYDDPGAMQISVLLIANALSKSENPSYMATLAERARTVHDPAERARLTTAALLGTFYAKDLPKQQSHVAEAVETATRAGMKRLLVPAGSMACLGGLAAGTPAEATAAALPLLQHLAVLPALSIMSSGMVTMFTEAAIQANLPLQQQLAAVRLLDPVLQGDFNRVGLALARLVERHGDPELAVLAVGACEASSRSDFSNGQRATVLALATGKLGVARVEVLLAMGATSERSDLYRRMWAALTPLMEPSLG